MFFPKLMRWIAMRRLRRAHGKCSLLSAMINKDFYNMAYNYNGSDFGDYDRKIEQTYNRLEQLK
jgi:hypothetical protein